MTRTALRLAALAFGLGVALPTLASAQYKTGDQMMATLYMAELDHLPLVAIA
jgi:hypothetical protein